MSRIQSMAKIAFCALALVALCWASITGSISGVVTDPSGAVVSGATVVATNIQTGITNTVVTDDKGFYSFQSLPIGTYTLGVSQTGFKNYSKTDLVVDANSALRADAVLQLGAASEKVEVTSDSVHVETENT